MVIRTRNNRLLRPARATTRLSLAEPRHPLADPVGWGFLRVVGVTKRLLSELTDYCNLSHSKKHQHVLKLRFATNNKIKIIQKTKKII